MKVSTDEQTFGHLVRHHRNLLNQNGDTVRGLFPNMSAGRYSQLETDKAGRPTFEMVQTFKDVYSLSGLDFTMLLRAADYAATEEETEAVKRSVRSSRVSKSMGPAFVMDYRGDMTMWNREFALRYDIVSPDMAETLPVPTSLVHGGVPRVEAAADFARRSGASSSPRLQGPDHHLYPGMSLLDLLFNWQYRLRWELRPEEWESLEHYFLVRFWRTIWPLLRPSWYDQDHVEPDWLRQLLARLGNLPNGAGADFVRYSSVVRQLLEVNPSDPKVQRVSDFTFDTVVYWHDPVQYEVHPTTLFDSRFVLFQHHPLDPTAGVPVEHHDGSGHRPV